ncbi:hypothetical protein D3C84_622210 [compost metagenome]
MHEGQQHGLPDDRQGRIAVLAAVLKWLVAGSCLSNLLSGGWAFEQVAVHSQYAVGDTAL